MLRCENKGYVNVCGVLNRYSIMYTCIHFYHTSFELVFFNYTIAAVDNVLVNQVLCCG